MASSVEFVEFVCEQLEGTGVVRSRKMFGDYTVYVDDRPVILVCDDIAYVAMHEELEEPLAGCPTGIPYPGARERYILDIDDRELTREVIKVVLPLTPIPKKRTKKKTS